MALVHASRFLSVGWTAVFTINGEEYRWSAGDAPSPDTTIPLSEDFVVVQPGNSYEFGFPLENFEHKTKHGEVKKLAEQKGELTGEIQYQIDDLTRKRWPTPTPGATPSADPRLVERCEVTVSFTLPYGKDMEESDDGDGPPPGIGGGPPRPDGGSPTPQPSTAPDDI